MPFRLILITKPDFFEGESRLLTRMLEEGLPLLHIRKPTASEEQMERFILSLPSRYRGRMAVHSHYPLVPRLGLRSAHLGKGRLLPLGFPPDIPTSYSCHSIAEVNLEKTWRDYVFLSPVFPSISKSGYLPPFTSAQLSEARLKGVIDGKVVALGGVSVEKIPKVKAMGFGGAALLGDVWLNSDPLGQLIKAMAACAAR